MSAATLRLAADNGPATVTRRSWRGRRVRLAIDRVEREALVAAMWHDAARRESGELRAMGRLWCETWSAPSGCINVPRGLVRALAHYLDAARLMPCARCNEHADALSELLNRLCASVEASLER
jgi:hypothetical protein